MFWCCISLIIGNYFINSGFCRYDNLLIQLLILLALRGGSKLMNAIITGIQQISDLIAAIKFNCNIGVILVV